MPTDVRLLYVITDLQRGGVPLHLFRLARHMRSHGFDPAVVCLSRPGPVSQMLEEAGIETGSCDARGAWDLRALFRLRRHIRDFAPDVIHSFLFHANVAARFAASWTGFDRTRLISEIQTVEIERRWHLTMERWTYRMSRVIVGNSPSVISHLATQGRIPPDHLRLVMGGVDTAEVRTAQPLPRRDLGAPDGHAIIMWVGRLDPIKGLDILLATMSRVRKRVPCHLLLVGDGPERPHIEQLITTLQLSDAVTMLGARADVFGILPHADVFAFPSRTEGLPNALLEALAAGRPIVTTDAPGCADVIRDGVTGLVVPRDNPDRLAEAIEKLLIDRNLAQVLGTAAARDAVERFDTFRTYADYQALYRETLESAAS